MADDKNKKTDAKAESAETAAPPARTVGRKKLVGIVGVVMVVEGIGVFAAMKLMGSGPEHGAAAPLKIEHPAPDKIEEIEVAQIRAPNVKEGKLVLWSLHVAVRVNSGACAPSQHAEGDHGGGHGDEKKDAKKESPVVGSIKSNERTIKDRLARIVRSAEPQHLQEDGLETIRRQIKHELESILGHDIKIVEVLVPECTPYPTGF